MNNQAALKTSPLPKFNKGLLQARHIQARLHGKTGEEAAREAIHLFAPNTAGPYLVPVTRWVE